MSVEKPIFTSIHTQRLFIRSIAPDDAPMINKAVIESFYSLHKWLPWATKVPTLHNSYEEVVMLYAEHLSKTNLHYLVFDREDHEHLIGMCSFNFILWEVPSADMGYWCRSCDQGKGYMLEAAHALTLFGFKQLGFKRITITCDEDNIPSNKIPQKLNFDMEVKAKGLSRSPHGGHLGMGIRYVCFDPKTLPEMEVRW